VRRNPHRSWRTKIASNTTGGTRKKKRVAWKDERNRMKGQAREEEEGLSITQFNDPVT
jgi:hypothetical protein